MFYVIKLCFFSGNLNKMLNAPPNSNARGCASLVLPSSVGPSNVVSFCFRRMWRCHPAISFVYSNIDDALSSAQ